MISDKNGGRAQLASGLVTQPDGYVTIGGDMSVLIGDLRVSKADGSQTPPTRNATRPPWPV